MPATEQPLTDGDRALSWAEVVDGLQRDAVLRNQLTDAIAGAPYPALFWETVPVSRDTVDLPFSMVVLDSPALAKIEPDRRPFPGALVGPATVASFANLSGDALLVSPRKIASRDCYPHLAAFVRTAPSHQVHDLWIAVGAAVQEELETRPDPVWVSTSGLGVPWLHVRLDRRPKYFLHGRYRQWPRSH